jgi:hypothetical protein
MNMFKFVFLILGDIFFCVVPLNFFLFNFIKLFSYACFFLLLLNKILFLKNNVIKYNWVHDSCFEIKYLHLYLSSNFLIYSLVKYRLVFTWFSHIIITFYSNMCNIHNIFFFWFHLIDILCVFISIIIWLNKKLILIKKFIKHNRVNDYVAKSNILIHIYFLIFYSLVINYH